VHCPNSRTKYFVYQRNESISELDDPVAQLVAMIYALLAAHRDDRASSLACLRELVRYFDGDLNEYVRKERARYTSIVVDILRDGVELGRLHTTDPDLTALHIFGMCNYAWTWYRPEGDKSIEDIARVFARDILDGLRHEPDETGDFDSLFTLAVDTVRAAPGRLPIPLGSPLVATNSTAHGDSAHSSG
jgi:TetR/AcrR family transcriptional regulator, cholesterol catabolism regulator